MTPTRIVLLMLFLVISIRTSAQTVQYFNSVFSIYESDTTDYYREYYDSLDYAYVKSYYEGRLINEGKYYGFSSIQDIDMYFYTLFGGNRFMMGDLLIHNLRTSLTTYDDFGNEYQNLLTHGFEIITSQIWDRDHKPLLINGNGSFRREEGIYRTRIMEYKDYLEVENYVIRIDKNDTVHYVVDEHASSYNKDAEFIKEVTKVLKYPGLAQFFGAEADVDLRFIINETGHVEDVEVINKRALGFDFEKSTIRRLQKLDPWKPALKNGRIVKQEFFMTIRYRFR